MAYLMHLGIIISIFAILGVSLNLVVGYAGLLSVAHAAFFGIGAYTTGVLLSTLGLNFFVAMGVGIVVTAIVSLLIGIVLSRFDDDYYALASLGFTVIILSVFMNWQEVTRGPLGIAGIDRPELFGLSFGSNTSFLLLSLVLFGLIFWASRYLVSSSFGRVLMAIRDDEGALRVFGYKTVSYKLAIFVISAAMASVAGALFASYITFIDPSSFGVMESVFLLALIILGGLGSTSGAVVGAVVLVLLPELLRFVGLPPEIAGHLRQVIFGVLLVLLMLYRPQGFLGKYRM